MITTGRVDCRGSTTFIEGVVNHLIRCRRRPVRDTGDNPQLSRRSVHPVTD